MKAFSHQGVLPASAAEILPLITDEAYLRSRYAAPELDRFEMRVEQDDAQAFAVTVTRTARPRGLPSFASRLLGERATLVQTTRWNRQGPPYAGEFRFHIEGLPGQVLTRLRLEDQPGGQAVMHSDGQVEAPVPLLGRRIEAMIAERAGDSFEASLAAIRERLTARD